jgi:hypothetical protein
VYTAIARRPCVIVKAVSRFESHTVGKMQWYWNKRGDFMNKGGTALFKIEH